MMLWLSILRVIHYLQKKNRKPNGEAPFHIHVLQKRPDFKAPVHAHPPKITGFSIANNDLLSKPLLPEPIIEVGPVLSMPYSETFSQELADAFDKVVILSNAFLMENHGVLTGSYESMERAVELLEMIEATADSISTALMVGEIHEISKEELIRLENVMKTRNLPLPGLPGKNQSLLDIYKVLYKDEFIASNQNCLNTFTNIKAENVPDF